MRGLFDIRFGRLSLALLTVVSAAATVLILTSGNEHSPAQLAALAALRDRPHPRTATVIASAPTTTAAAPTPVPSPGTSSHTGALRSSASTQSAPPPATAGTSTAAASQPPSTGTATSPGRSSSSSSPAPAHRAHPATSDLPKVGHVFEIMLSDARYGAAFGRHSGLSYLRSLARKGTVLSGYRSLGSGELADELAVVSGQGPNADTADGCPKYLDFSVKAVADAAGIVPGRGCVYPETALTIGDEVSATGKRWGAYVADMGKDTCVHPNSGVADDVALPDTDPGYDTRHNPFIYFHSLLDLGDCASDDMDISHLSTALSRPSRTPEFTYLAPSACADADPTMASTGTTGTTGTGATGTTGTGATTTSTTSTTSANTTTTASTTSTNGTSPAAPPATPAGCPAGAASGPAAENAFLRQWVPRILRSAAYRSDGMLIVAFAHAGASHGHAPRTGALVLSRWTPRGHSVTTACDPYALLRLGEQALRLKALAHARTAPSIASLVLKKPS